MVEKNYDIQLRPVGEEVNIIDIQGDLTNAAEEALLGAFTQATDNGARIILLGFDHLAYMNSAGIGLLVRLVIRAQRQSQQILAFGLREHYQRIFALTRLQEVIQVYDTETAALASLSPVGVAP